MQCAMMEHECRAVPVVQPPDRILHFTRTDWHVSLFLRLPVGLYRTSFRLQEVRWESVVT